MSVLASSRSRGSMAFTFPCVPTGRKAGVSTMPCGSSSRPRRAAVPGSRWTIVSRREEAAVISGMLLDSSVHLLDAAPGIVGGEDLRAARRGRPRGGPHLAETCPVPVAEPDEAPPFPFRRDLEPGAPEHLAGEPPERLGVDLVGPSL